MLALLPAFAVDSFLASVGLATAGTAGRWRTAITFGLFEGLMPLVGLGIGSAARGLLAAAGPWIGAGLLALLGVRELREGWRELHEAPQAQGRSPRPAPAGWSLLMAGLSVSVDELVAGAAAGSAGFPVAVFAPALALQAVLFTGLGWAAGRRLARVADRYGEVVAGLALVGTALALAITRL